MISILMPVFNEEKHLKVCLDSIIMQSEKDWELLAIDDFSTDRSWDILMEYATNDSRIRIFKNKTKGIIPALELAYAQSTGDKISRMDADDKMHAEKLEKLGGVLGLHPKACATAMVEYFSDVELADGFLRYADWLNHMVLAENHYENIFKECVVASPCWMMYRETLESIGGICGHQYPEDYDMVFRMYEHGVSIKSVSEVLHYWRDHGERASRNDPNYAQQDFVELKMHYLLKTEGLTESNVILWGAGGAGKLWAKALQKEEVKFSWLTENIKKIGKDIYGQRLKGLDQIKEVKENVIMLAIKAPSFYEERGEFIEGLKRENKVIFLY